MAEEIKSEYEEFETGSETEKFYINGKIQKLEKKIGDILAIVWKN